MYNSTASGIKSPQITSVFPKNLRYQPLTNPSFRQTSQGFESILPTDATFYGVKAHVSVYSFFNTNSSILDRLANELAQLFPSIIKASRPDWSTLFDKAGQSLFATVDPDLAAILQNHRTHIESSKTLRYRNVHTHLGYIRILIEANTTSHEWRIFLPDDPDNASSPRSILAIPFMTTELSHTIELLNGVYGSILKRLGSSLPPW